MDLLKFSPQEPKVKILVRDQQTAFIVDKGSEQSIVTISKVPFTKTETIVIEVRGIQTAYLLCQS